MYKTLLIATLTATTLTGCANTGGLGGADYPASQVRGTQSVRFGTVQATRPVTITAQGSMLGEIAGGVVGATLGHTLGAGVGNLAGTVLGGLAGSAAGGAIENSSVNNITGVEVTLKLDTGYVIAIVQGADEHFAVGERVQVLGYGGESRVTAYSGK